MLLDLGEQHLTGVFPRDSALSPTCGPLQLVKCHGTSDDNHCGLVQLRHSYNSSEMYGLNYGYRSALNRSMVEHLAGTVHELRQRVSLAPDDLVIDIGSNDGTTLAQYPQGSAVLLGIDPTARKFRRYYRPDIHVVEDFFSAERVRGAVPARKARIITSIAMFYDLERPIDFVAEVAQILAPNGVWLLEQSYLPSMLEANAYDTICHEHIEYYALRQIKWLTDRCGLRIIDVRTNPVNGGSFAVTVAHADSTFVPNARVDRLLERENDDGLENLSRFERFRDAVMRHREELPRTLRELRQAGARVIGYGASTKGNVILQFCRIGPEELPFIADVNPDKDGCVTPGTGIPIITEALARELAPDHYLVFPWHFRENLILREAAFLDAGGKMIFPLPQIEIFGR